MEKSKPAGDREKQRAYQLFQGFPSPTVEQKGLKAINWTTLQALVMLLEQ